MPLPTLSREKITDKEKEEKEHYKRLCLTEERKIESGFSLKEKKKRTFLGTWSLRKKEKKRYMSELLFSWREEVMSSFPVL